MKEIGQNIFKDQARNDFKIIANLISPNSRVIDIGCGDGELLKYLQKNKNIDCRGIELSQAKVSKALMGGISVVQGNAENDLFCYPDSSFDYAILSHTIQAMHQPDKVLQEMLRISKCAIVALPNFAHFRNRLHLLFKGTMPVSETIPYQWYETPNIHFCSIKDFEILCFHLNFSIIKSEFLTKKIHLRGIFKQKYIANLFAEYGIFKIIKKDFALSGEEEFLFKKNLFSKQKLSFNSDISSINNF